MSIFSNSFIFNGITSQELGVVLCSFEQNSERHETGISFNINKSNLTPNRDKANLYSKSYASVLSFTMSLVKCDGKLFTRDEYFNLVKIFTSPLSYSALTLEDEYHKDITYYVICKKYTEWMPDSNMRGLEFEFECNAPYGFEIKTLEFDETVKSILIDNTSHEMNKLYYPEIEITATQTGTITLTNITTGAEPFTINLRNTQKVYIDNELGDMYDNMNLLSYEDSNLKWLGLQYGVNTIRVSGECRIRFICKYIRKVGI